MRIFCCFFFFNFILEGGIFSKDRDDVVKAFESAVQIINRENGPLQLQTHVVTVDTNDNFAVQLAGEHGIVLLFK